MGGNSNYNALQFQGKKRRGEGEYTYSICFTMRKRGTWERKEGRATQTHSLAMTYIYDRKIRKKEK